MKQLGKSRYRDGEMREEKLTMDYHNIDRGIFFGGDRGSVIKNILCGSCR